MTWNASTAANVAGYQIYYGPASGYYTNYISVGNVTNVTVNGLADGTTYFFAAKSYSSAGIQSDFSNETLYNGITAQPGVALHLSTAPLASNNRYHYSLAAGSPAGATIGATNGNFAWTPTISQATTTNRFTVVLQDTLSNTTNLESLVVVVGDYFNIQTGPAVTVGGQDGRIPIILNSSAGATNIIFNLGWQPNLLLNPTLSSGFPQAACSLQNFGTYLQLHFWTTSGQIPSGSNQIGQLTFQVASQPVSTDFKLGSTMVSSVTAKAVSYGTPTINAADVVVVGTQPLLKPSVTSNTGKKLLVYSTPQTNYQVQMTTNVSDNNSWQTVLTYAQTNLTQEISLTNSAPAVFYRIIHQ